jgi:GWxTD domain-containing protein
MRFEIMSKRFLVGILCWGLIGAVGLSAVQKEKPTPSPSRKETKAAKPPQVNVKTLDPIYQDFLKLVTYIITPKEKEVFLQLTNDRDRNIFMDSFWKLRDPTPGTPQNEYKEEIIRRFNYVNKRFASGRPGWMTDRGRFYMILGEPNSYDRYPGNLGIVPCEVWYYYTDGSKNLPSHFALVFFQKGGAGDYRLYDPFVDGPKSLMESIASSRNIDPDDYETIHDRIQNLAPALADISISLIPGEFGYGYQPTSRSTELIASVIQSPKTNINPLYATHFFDYKGMVTTEYLTNYVESQGLAAVIQDPILNLPFVHFTVSPLTMTLDYYDAKKQYYCDVKMDVSLRQEKNVIYQFSREFPLYFPEDDVDRVRHAGIAFEDSFPAVVGDYTLTVLIQNTVGKEFSVMERTVSVPPNRDVPALNGPFIGYKVESYESNVHIPFKTVDRKLDIDPKMTFGTSDQIAMLFNVMNLTQDLWQGGEVAISLKGQSKAPTVKNYTIQLSNSPYSGTLNLVQVVPAADMIPDYYQAKLSLIGPDKRVLDEKTADFAISTERGVAHPIAKSKGFSLANQYYFYYLLGCEYDKMDQNDQAEAQFSRGYSQNPGYQEGVLEYSRFLLKVHKYDKALEIVESLKDSDKSRFDYFLVKGLATMGLGDFTKAIDLLQNANKVYNSDIVLLNALGTCYAKTNQREQALAAYRASLKLNDKQPEVVKAIASLEKSK